MSTTKICPKCGSTSIHPYSVMMGFAMESSLREFCMNCAYGYNEPVVFPEMTEEAPTVERVISRES